MLGVDIFSGVGGMALGASWAGIDIIHAVEIEKYTAQTYKWNHPATNVIIDDIKNVREVSLPRNDEGLVLFGGPPCQGFSTSNQRTRNRNNPNNWLFKEFLRFVELLSPDWVIFENVKGIAETCGGIFLDYIIVSLEELGFTTSCWVLNAADFGVPQMRNRLFVVGSCHNVKISKPQPRLKKYLTVKSAINDLPLLDNGAYVDRLPYRTKAESKFSKQMRNGQKFSLNNLVTRNADHIIERYKCIPQGGNWEDIPREMMDSYTDTSNCHTGIYHRLRLDAPSVVIANYRKNMLIHPIQNRGLSVREAARLQSFPDSYRFFGSIGFQQQQVANAVPPLLAKEVFMQLSDPR
ncbi:MAG: DNA cytosine methyltransferase [Deltaproteobacteria bacterium]|nr:DNA cytosine methyltransferase [Deltaproteobacteria bacterium]